MAGGAALSILLGFCLRCCLSKEKAAGGGAGGGSAGGGSAGNDNGEPTYTSAPFVETFAEKKTAVQNAFKAASMDPKHAGKVIPLGMEDPADIFGGNAGSAQSAIGKLFG